MAGSAAASEPEPLLAFSGLAAVFDSLSDCGDFSEAAFHTPGHWHHYTISDETDSAAQGLAGVRFRLNSFSEAGLGYKFLEAFPGGGRDVDTHAVEAFITIKF